MRFIHMADMHFDSPFVNLSEKDMLGDLRRLEQRKIFKKISMGNFPLISHAFFILIFS